jgi:hypothetical protein
MVDKVTPDTAEQIRAHGYKQGRLISPENTAKIIEDAIDFYDKDGSTDTWLVVITQDCDLVRRTHDEPYVELLALQELSSKPRSAFASNCCNRSEPHFLASNKLRILFVSPGNGSSTKR